MQVIRCALLFLPVSLPAMQAEVRALPDVWKLHFQTAHYEGAWSALPLRSLGGSMDSMLPFALGGGPAEYENTALLAACPTIAALLSGLACPVRSARLMKLEAGAVIKPHRDNDLSFEQGEARLHFPIFTNPDLEFFIEDERITMEEGSCWYINANLRHWVANRGSADRIHLVVDCGVNAWLRDLFDRGSVHQVTIRRSAAELRQMIGLLRDMNNAAALGLIPGLEEELKHAS